MTRIALCCFVLLAGACATSGAARLETRLIDLGLSPASAECMAGELAEELDRSDFRDLAEFLDRIERADRRPGAAIDAMMSIDNPRALAAVAGAGVTCALRG